MIQIHPFTTADVEEAGQIALKNYLTERERVPALPQMDSVPDLSAYVKNNLSVAAFDGGKMVGFLCSVPPYKNAFRSTDAVGMFSPMGAHGATGKNRARVYALMYEAAAHIWARAGITSHAVCLYTHDGEVQEQFFRYGFGIRCVDAIRGMDKIEARDLTGVDFLELKREEISEILPLDHLLDEHMASSPTFILRPSETQESFLEKANRSGARFFTAQANGQITAFIKVEREGETFICDTPGYRHITGAFCLPEHRGKGVYQNLLNFAITTLRAEGYTKFGVDFESFNPTAWGFWLKYFDAYTYGVVRRIDEHAAYKLRC